MPTRLTGGTPDAQREAACPHCGSIKGYAVVARLKGEKLFSWGTHDNASTELTVVWESTMARCIDCGRGVRRDKAEGETSNGH